MQKGTLSEVFFWPIKMFDDSKLNQGFLDGFGSFFYRLCFFNNEKIMANSVFGFKLNFYIIQIFV